MDASERLSSGSRAVLQNLQKKPELNNKLVVIETYLGDQEGRYKVRPLGAEAKRLAPSTFMSIQAANLRAAPDSAFIASVQYQGQDLLLPLTRLADRDGFG